MPQARWKVTGTRPVRGHRPGKEFEADLPDAQAQRLQASGAIVPAGETSAPEKTDGLSGLNREELNALAADHGVENPDGLANKVAVIEAIEAAKSPAAAGSNDNQEE